MDTQKEIQDVAHKLKESNKSLCRNLKENPNVQVGVLRCFKMFNVRLVPFWLSVSSCFEARSVPGEPPEDAGGEVAGARMARGDQDRPHGISTSVDF